MVIVTTITKLDSFYISFNVRQNSGVLQSTQTPFSLQMWA